MSWKTSTSSYARPATTHNKFQETPTRGMDISDARHDHKCSNCKQQVLLGRVKLEQGLKWRNFDPKPIEINGQNYYRRHRCQRREDRYEGR